MSLCANQSAASLLAHTVLSFFLSVFYRFTFFKHLVSTVFIQDIHFSFTLSFFLEHLWTAVYLFIYFISLHMHFLSFLPVFIVFLSCLCIITPSFQIMHINTYVSVFFSYFPRQSSIVSLRVQYSFSESVSFFLSRKHFVMCFFSFLYSFLQCLSFIFHCLSC